MKRKEIEAFITNGEIDKSINYLLEKFDGNDSDIHREILVLKQRYKALEKDTRQGVLSVEQKNLQRNRITSDLLSLCKEIFEDQYHKPLPQVKKKVKLWLVFPLVLVSIGICWWAYNNIGNENSNNTKNNNLTLVHDDSSITPKTANDSSVPNNTDIKTNELESATDKFKSQSKEAPFFTRKKRDIAIITISDNDVINDEFGKNIVIRLKQDGYTASTSFFNNLFYSDGYLKDLKEGDYSFIDNSDLSIYLNYIYLVEVIPISQKKIDTSETGLLVNDIEAYELKRNYRTTIYNINNHPSKSSIAFKRTFKTSANGENLDALALKCNEQFFKELVKYKF